MKGQTNSWIKGGVSGEKISISLLTNQSSHEDLIGAIITVSYAGVHTDYVWEGNAIQTIIPPTLDYTISYSQVNGYDIPESYNGKSVDGHVQEVVAVYRTELLTVNVSADEGTASGYEIQIGKMVESIMPDSYMLLEYIDSDGTQYIDTKIVGRSGISMEMDMEILVWTQNLIAGSRGSQGRFYLAGVNANPNNTSSYGWLLGYSDYTTVSNQEPRTNTRYTIHSTLKAGEQSLIVNGENVITRSDDIVVDTGRTIYICGYNNGGIQSPSGIRIYGLKLYYEDTLVRDYVPVKNSSGVPGLFDKVDGVFYPSNSDTPFTAGKNKGEFIKELVFEPIYKQNEPSETHKIPYGLDYVIKSGIVPYYITPEDLTVKASQAKRNVEIIYKHLGFGVYTVNKKGTLGDMNIPIDDGVAVAVVSDNVRVMLAPVKYSGYQSSNGYLFDQNVGGNNNVIIPNDLSVFSSASSALSDYKGIQNNSILYKAWSGDSDRQNYGLYKANDFRFNTNRKPKGRLPSAGELKAIFDNLSNLKIALYNAGLSASAESATIFEESGGGDYFWTTTRAANSGITLQFYRLKYNGDMSYSPADYLYDLVFVTSEF